MSDRKYSCPTTPSPNASPYEIFLTPKELAARNRRSEKTLRNNRVTGTCIPFLKIRAWSCTRFLKSFRTSKRIV